MHLSFQVSLRCMKSSWNCVFISRVPLVNKTLCTLRSQVLKLCRKVPGYCIHCWSMLNILQLQEKQFKKAFKVITGKHRELFLRTTHTFDFSFSYLFARFISLQAYSSRKEKCIASLQIHLWNLC